MGFQPVHGLLLVRRRVVTDVKQVHGPVEGQRRFPGIGDIQTLEQVGDIAQGPRPQILLVQRPHLPVTVLLQGQHFPEAAGELLLRPVPEHGLAEGDDLLDGGAPVLLRHPVRRVRGQVIGLGVFPVQLLHPGQDMVKNISFVFVMLVKGPLGHAQGPGDLADGDRLIAVPGEQPQRRQQNMFLGTAHLNLQK